MRNSGVALLFGVALLLAFAACQNRPFQTVAIYDDPSRFVRLEVDPTVGGRHSHPADITTDELIAVLSDGRLMIAPLDSLHWRPFLSDYTGVRSISILQGA